VLPVAAGGGSVPPSACAAFGKPARMGLHLHSSASVWIIKMALGNRPSWGWGEAFRSRPPAGGAWPKAC
jgi:hypothetical protein